MNSNRSCTTLDMVKILHEYALLPLCCLNIIANIASKVTFQIRPQLLHIHGSHFSHKTSELQWFVPKQFLTMIFLCLLFIKYKNILTNTDIIHPNECLEILRPQEILPKYCLQIMSCFSMEMVKTTSEFLCIFFLCKILQSEDPCSLLSQIRWETKYETLCRVYNSTVYSSH